MYDGKMLRIGKDSSWRIAWAVDDQVQLQDLLLVVDLVSMAQF